MKLEAFHNKDKKKKFIIGFTIICIALVVGVFLYHSYAWFADENTFNSFSGDVTPVGDLYFSIYVDDEASATLPSSSSGYAFNHGTCTNGASVTWDSTNWAPTVTNLTSTRTKCMLYFNLTAQATLNKLNITPSPAASCPTMDPTTKELQISAIEDTQSLLCEAEDDYGTTYYYRGNVTNNYVKFGKWQTDYYYGYANYSTNGIYTSLTDCETAVGSGNCTKIASTGDDMYWRIVRINGDGSIRMVYDGTEAYANIKNGGLTSNGIYRSIGERGFSVGAYSAAPTAYMRGSTNGSDYATDFNVMNNKNGVSSLIKETVDSWYENNIDITIPSSTKKYSDYISLDSIYCNDKNLYSGTYNYVQVAFYHGINMGSSIPVRFTCVNTQGTVDSKNDAFTVSTKGNGALTYPSAILTLDEAIAAGYYEYPTSASPYLSTGISNWAMTPTYYDTADVTANVSYFDTYAGVYNITNLAGIRPVISLKANVTFASGTDGTINNPYEIVYN